MAIALIAALRRFGLSVPGDLSVVGFDGIEFGQMMEPALATIATDPMAMGRASADTVLSNISNTAQDAAATHAAAFVFRTGGSLGAPADGKALAKKLHLLRQLSLPREKSETSRQER